MINLTPIDIRIQKRLFEKMNVLSRSTSAPPNQSAKDGDTLTHAKMATRSTFLRMTSGLENPVILMGGELVPKGDASDSEGNFQVGNTGRIASGYDEIYGARTYNTPTSNGELLSAANMEAIGYYYTEKNKFFSDN